MIRGASRHDDFEPGKSGMYDTAMSIVGFASPSAAPGAFIECMDCFGVRPNVRTLAFHFQSFCSTVLQTMLPILENRGQFASNPMSESKSCESNRTGRVQLARSAVRWLDPD